MKIIRALTVLAVVCLAACSTGVVPAGPDTYIVSQKVSSFGSTGGGKAAAYREANAWCAKRGLVMVPISVDTREARPGQMGTAELTFRALRPGDPEIVRPTVEKPDHVQRVQMR